MDAGPEFIATLQDDYRRLADLAMRRTGTGAFLEACHRMLAHRTGAEGMALLLDKGGPGLSLAYAANLAPAGPGQRGRLDPPMDMPREGLAAELASCGRLRWRSAEEGLPGRLDERMGPASDWASAPIVDRDGRTKGALVAQGGKPGFRFMPADMAFIEYAAVQVSLALQLDELERELAVLRIADLVEDTTDLDRLYSGIHTIVADLVPTARRSFIIARMDHQARLFRPVYCVDEREAFAAGPWHIETGLTGYVTEGEGRSFVFEDGISPEPAGYAVMGARPAWWLGVPLRHGRRVIGVVVSQTYDRAERITQDDRLNIEAIAPHIAHAIERTSLFMRNRK